MYKRCIIFASLVIMGVFFFLSGSPALAAYLYIDPPTKQVQVGETFSVTVKINTESQTTNAAEAWINYDGTGISFTDAKDPTGADKFYSEKLVSKSTSTLIYVANWITFGADPIKSPPEGFAVLNFKALKAGTFTLDIKCTQGDTKDSAIAARVNKKTEDIIDCSKTKDATITASGGGSGGGSTPTPTPSSGGSTGAPTPTRLPTPTGSTRISSTPAPTVATQTGTPTPTPTASPTPTVVSSTSTPTPTATSSAVASPSALPKTGSVETSAVVLGIGLALTVVSIVIKIFIL